MKRVWLVVLLPIAAGPFSSVLLTRGYLPNPTIVLRADLAALCTVAGLLVAGLIALTAMFYRQRVFWQESLQHAKRAAAEKKGRFIRRLNHEFKNPLTAMRACLASIVAELATKQGSLHVMEDQLLRLSRLAEDLRKLAELETHPLERTRVKVRRLLEEIMVSVQQDRPEAKERSLVLTIPQTPWP